MQRRTDRRTELLRVGDAAQYIEDLWGLRGGGLHISMGEGIYTKSMGYCGREISKRYGVQGRRYIGTIDGVLWETMAVRRRKVKKNHASS